MLKIGDKVTIFEEPLPYCSACRALGFTKGSQHTIYHISSDQMQSIPHRPSYIVLSNQRGELSCPLLAGVVKLTAPPLVCEND